MKRVILFGLISLFTCPIAFAKPCSDIPDGHWATDSIVKSVRAGIISVNGSYHGKRLINRYQIAHWANRFLYHFERQKLEQERKNKELTSSVTKSLERMRANLAKAKSLNKRLKVIEDSISTNQDHSAR